MSVAAWTCPFMWWALASTLREREQRHAAGHGSVSAHECVRAQPGGGVWPLPPAFHQEGFLVIDSFHSWGK